MAFADQLFNFNYSLTLSLLQNSFLLLILRIIIRLFSFLPFSFLYLLSDGLYLVLYHLLRYRRSVVDQNLQNAFPTKPAAERRWIQKKFYRNFCDILLEGLKGFSLDEKTLRERYFFKNPELINQSLSKGQSALLIGSHLTNWEWGVLAVPLWINHPVAGVYKPIKNNHLNDYMNSLRSQWNLQLLSMQDSAKTILRSKSTPTAFVFFSDQTPSNTRSAHWLPFLHQDTPFLPGVDKIARRTNFPVFAFDIQRKERGYYEVTFELLAAHPTNQQASEITNRYAKYLEKRIEEKPEDWLWSHKRWKHRR